MGEPALEPVLEHALQSVIITAFLEISSRQLLTKQELPFEWQMRDPIPELELLRLLTQEAEHSMGSWIQLDTAG